MDRFEFAFAHVHGLFSSSMGIYPAFIRGLIYNEFVVYPYYTIFSLYVNGKNPEFTNNLQCFRCVFSMSRKLYFMTHHTTGAGSRTPWVRLAGDRVCIVVYVCGVVRPCLPVIPSPVKGRGRGIDPARGGPVMCVSRKNFKKAKKLSWNLLTKQRKSGTMFSWSIGTMPE